MSPHDRSQMTVSLFMKRIALRKFTNSNDPELLLLRLLLLFLKYFFLSIILQFIRLMFILWIMTTKMVNVNVLLAQPILIATPQP